LAALPKSMGGIAPVRQIDPLIEFTAKACARRYLAPRSGRNTVTPLPHMTSEGADQVYLKTAKALGLDVSLHLQQRADEVIE